VTRLVYHIMLQIYNATQVLSTCPSLPNESRMNARGSNRSTSNHKKPREPKLYSQPRLSSIHRIFVLLIASTLIIVIPWIYFGTKPIEFHELVLPPRRAHVRTPCSVRQIPRPSRLRNLRDRCSDRPRTGLTVIRSKHSESAVEASCGLRGCLSPRQPTKTIPDTLHPVLALDG